MIIYTAEWNSNLPTSASVLNWFSRQGILEYLQKLSRPMRIRTQRINPHDPIYARCAKGTMPFCSAELQRKIAIIRGEIV